MIERNINIYRVGADTRLAEGSPRRTVLLCLYKHLVVGALALPSMWLFLSKRFLQLHSKFRKNFKDIADNSVVGNLKNRCILVLVNRHNIL